jgi:hypothetical protein
MPSNDIPEPTKRKPEKFDPVKDADTDLERMQSLYFYTKQQNIHASYSETNFQHSVSFLCASNIQGDQKVSTHLMITVQETSTKYFKQFQSLAMIT